MSPSPPACFSSLPPELVIRIIRYYLDPQSITRLSATSRGLFELCRSELVWKQVVVRLVERYGVVNNNYDNSLSATSIASVGSSEGNSWWQQAKFLLPYARHLGYFASSIPFSSRIIRISILVPPSSSTTPSLGTSPPEYQILASHLLPSNAYSLASPAPAHLLPFGATLEMTLDAYNISRFRNPLHPESGVSTDLLEPLYEFDEGGMVHITREEGAVLIANRQGGGGGRVPGRGVRVGYSNQAQQAPPHQLRLLLELTSQPVHGTHTGLGASPPSSATFDNPEEISREALLALFSGRLPRRSWPTLELVGLTYDGDEEIDGIRSRRPVKKLRLNGKGAFRGIEEWVKQRGESESVARISPTNPGQEVGSGEEAFVTGFKLRAKRTASSAFPSTGALPTPPVTAQDQQDANRRRRGIGRNGGMAVLWDGAEEDPDEAHRGVTILRAGEIEQGGVVLQLRHEGNREAPPPASRTTETPAEGGLSEDSDDDRGEAFFPIKSPAKPIEWDLDETCIEGGRGQDISAASLEGMWVGTYGSHGLEFVHLSTSDAPTSPPSSSLSESRPLTPTSDFSDDVSSASTSTESRKNRILTATKLTGDTNVPSGETTWIAFLDEDVPIVRQLRSQDLEIADDSITTISSSKWFEMNHYDPTSAIVAASGGERDRNGHVRYRYTAEDWAEGVVKGVGQIALSGFLQPGWTEARVRFIRTTTLLKRNKRTGEVRKGVEEERSEEDDADEWETKEVESVEEIQLRWTELNKIAVFKRVRIGQ